MAKHVYDTKLILVYTTIVILWWASVWGLFEEFIQHASSKNPITKAIMYLSIIIIIIALTSYNPDSLDHF